MIEDLTPGPSWLSYARNSGVQANKAAAGALRGESPSWPAPKKKNLYTGQTYNSADAIAEFFKSRRDKKDGDSSPEQTEEQQPSKPTLSSFDRLKAAGTTPKAKQQAANEPRETGFTPGSHVTHEKYGRGLVLRREGSGDNVKLTVSFPGFGQKKLIEKFANLQKA